MEYCRESDANTITQKYMDSILIEERIIDSVVASTETIPGGDIQQSCDDAGFLAP